MCGVAISVEGQEILDIRGDAEDPLSHGHICPKAVALKDLHQDPDRLRRPLKRTKSGWEELGWDEAFDEVAARIAAIQKEHGRDSVAIYQGNPTVHNHGSMIHGQYFVRALRSKNRYSATSLDQLPHMLAGLTMFGHQLLLPIPDVDRTDLFVIIGGNPLASNGSLMSAPGIKKRLQAIRARGGRVIVIDPRFTETAAIADQHLFIRPGTDSLLLLAILQVLLAEGGMKLGRLAELTDGAERLPALVAEFPPERVAGPTGISAQAIRELARAIGAARSAAIYGRVGVSTQEFGGLATWLITVIQAVTGNLDRAGGSMFTKPAIDIVAAATKAGLAGHFGLRKSRVRGLPEFGGEYPAAVLAEEIETEGQGRIRGLVTSAGNPVLSSPNGRRLEAALAKLDFMVSIDLYLNETTRHAHLILPPTSPLEHGHYDLAFHLLAVRNTTKFSPPLFPRPADARHDWEIFGELAARLEAKNAVQKFFLPVKRRVMGLIDPEKVLDLGLRFGPYKLSLSKLRKAPHGIDLGPLEPCLPERLNTANKRIALVPELYVEDLSRLKARLLEMEGSNGHLALIGRRELLSNNSWMHNSKRLVRGKSRCTLRMHPEDATRLGLDASVGRVSVTSRAGMIVADLEISDEMMPGVVSLPHGWGHHREGIKLSVAQSRPGVSLNDITDEGFIDALTGTIAFSGVPVTIARAKS
jgi:anaerobic selenocysteine-containing dehydrogenase